MDIAVDPLEGTTITAKGGPNALAVVALAERGNFLHAPDIYMDKIAVGGGLPEGVVDLDALGRRRTCATSPAPRSATSATSSSACSSATATPSCSPSAARPAPAPCCSATATSPA